MPQTISPRYEQYARACASVGINASVLNNVNASPEMLATAYLQKVKILADIFRPYGMKIYLCVNFASPKELGKLPTADPMDAKVIAWWQDKAKEILLEDAIHIEIAMKQGDASATAWGCDLTYDYVKINGDYRT